MIYLEKFELLTGEACREEVSMVQNRETRDEDYPAYLFSKMDLKSIDFEDITILYGGNGSGKTTLLNVITEKIGLLRNKEYVQTEFFKQYIQEFCSYKPEKKKLKNIFYKSKFLASDDVFDHILSVREDNRNTKYNKEEARRISNEIQRRSYKHYFSNLQIDFESETHKDVLDNLKMFVDAKTLSTREFMRSRAGKMQRQYSNGENALMFFDKEIEKNALYLLDEPENSLSPKFQVDLKYLIEDSVRYKNCQFIIATHSPFILSLKGAKIYNLDETPVSVQKWYELENVKFTYKLFKENQEYFKS